MGGDDGGDFIHPWGGWLDESLPENACDVGHTDHGGYEEHEEEEDEGERSDWTALCAHLPAGFQVPRLHPGSPALVHYCGVDGETLAVVEFFLERNKHNEKKIGNF